MALIVNKEQDRTSDLDDRITADLRRKAQETTDISDPDFVRDADYVKETKKTGRFGWVWAVLIILALISIVIITVA